MSPFLAQYSPLQIFSLALFSETFRGDFSSASARQAGEMAARLPANTGAARVKRARREISFLKSISTSGSPYCWPGFLRHARSDALNKVPLQSLAVKFILPTSHNQRRHSVADHIHKGAEH